MKRIHKSIAKILIASGLLAFIAITYHFIRYARLQHIDHAHLQSLIRNSKRTSVGIVVPKDENVTIAADININNTIDGTVSGTTPYGLDYCTVPHMPFELAVILDGIEIKRLRVYPGNHIFLRPEDYFPTNRLRIISNGR